ncbi:MAG TPA: 2OG-Fe(II) oxygenase [Euzebya sp.]|nr:2OG-Fe(II) oxygenase [Euzebya sp.]
MNSGATAGTPPGLERGERAPDMVLPIEGTPTRFYAHAGGRPAVLIHAGNASPAAVQGLAEGLMAGEHPMTVHIVGPPDLAQHELPCPLLQDRTGAAGQALRTGGQPVAFLLDRNLRVQQRFGVSATAAPDVLAMVQQLWDAEPEAREITRQTPVLIVPDVLDDAMCAQLIEVWAADNHATGVESSTDGRRAETGNAKLKRRRDHIVEDAALGQRLAETIGRRVMPELRRAFAYRASRFEGFKIGCYTDTDRGFFSPHRDNLSPSTAHRAFALTLNLNEDYEGGQLRFPEYGPDRFRPPKGAALMFSGSLLHEVLDVTAGRRFVLLSFLFADPPATG